MAVATDSTPAPTRRLLRAHGPCAVLTTADVLALIRGEDLVAVEAAVEQSAFLSSPAHITARHARVFRQHDAGVRPRMSQRLSASIGLRRHGRFSRSVLPTFMRVRS